MLGLHRSDRCSGKGQGPRDTGTIFPHWGISLGWFRLLFPSRPQKEYGALRGCTLSLQPLGQYCLLALWSHIQQLVDQLAPQFTAWLNPILKGQGVPRLYGGLLTRADVLLHQPCGHPRSLTGLTLPYNQP
jgi:hypothetical protein